MQPNRWFGCKDEIQWPSPLKISLEDSFDVSHILPISTWPLTLPAISSTIFLAYDSFCPQSHTCKSKLVRNLSSRPPTGPVNLQPWCLGWHDVSQELPEDLSDTEQLWSSHTTLLAIRQKYSLSFAVFGETYLNQKCPVHTVSEQCVANIWIFWYIRMFIDKYIHLSKYMWIFSKQIYLDIHSRLYPPLEYIRTFIRIVRFEWIYSNVFIMQNKTFYATNFKQFDFFFFIKYDMLYDYNWFIFCIQIYLSIHSTEYIRTFIGE